MELRGVCETEIPGRGRPPTLDPKLATEIAALLIAGHTTSEVAQLVGVSRRSIARRRARAWSDREGEQACVVLEQMIWRGRVAAAEDALNADQFDSVTSALQPFDDFLHDVARDLSRDLP